MRRRLVLLALLFPLAALAQEESDKDFLTRLLERSLSGSGRQVEIDGFAGALSSEARFDRLTVSDAQGEWLVIEGGRLNWDRGALVTGRVDIDRLAAEVVQLIRWPVASTDPIKPEATAFALPDLPVSVDVGALNVERISIAEGIAGEPVEMSLSGALALGGGEGSAQLLSQRIDGGSGAFALEASYSNESRILKAFLDLDEGEGGLAAKALGIAGTPALHLTLGGEAPIEAFAATLALDTDGVRRLEGRIAFGLGEEAQYDLALSGDISALFLPEYRPFFGQKVELTTSAMRRSTGQLVLSDLSLSSRSLVFKGSARLTSSGWPERFDLEGRLADPEGAPVLLPLSGPATTVASADLSLAYDAGKGDLWSATLHADDIGRPGFSATTALIEGSGTITQGEDEAPRRFDGTIAYRAAGVAFSDQQLSAALGEQLGGGVQLSHVDGRPFRIRSLTLEGPGIGLSANADISGAGEDFMVRTDASFDIESLERFSLLTGRDLSGAARATLGGNIQPTDLSFNLWLNAETNGLAVGLANLDPLLTGRAAGSARLIRDGAGARVEGLNVQGGAFAAKGALSLTSQSLEADLRLDLADLALVVPGVDGPATFEIIARREPDGATSLALSAAGAGEELALTGQISADAPREFRGTAKASSRDLSRISSLAGIQIGGQADATINGRATLDFSDFAIAAEATTSNLELATDILNPLLAGAGKIQAVVERREGTAIFVPSLSAETANLSLSGRFTLMTDGPKAEFSTRIADMGLIASDFAGPLEATGIATHSDDGLWRLQSASLSGPGGLQADIGGSVSEDLVADLRLSGALPLGLLNQILEPRRAAGMVRFDLGLLGRLDSNILGGLSGTLSLAEGRLADPLLGQSIEGLSGAASFEGGRARIDLSGTSPAGGDARLSGVVGLSAPISADLGLQLSGWVLRDPALYQTTLDGAVGISGPLTGGALISGEVRLGTTELRVPSSSISAAGDIPEITHIGASPNITETLARAGLNKAANTGGGRGVPYDLNIRILAPEQVFVRGRGLDAELGGALTLGGSTADIAPVGRLDLIRGRLDILQQRFDLTQGSADIGGDLMPEIQLAATTTARSGTIVNLSVEGSLDSPDFVLSSTPDLPQDEIISQLLFGRGIDQISPLQAVQLASAVATLAGRGGAGLVDKLRQRFGLDDLDISSNPEGDTTFRVGKYFGENLYSDVAVSSGGQSELSLNLDLSETLTAKGSIDSEGQTSLGIFFERDY